MTSFNGPMVYNIVKTFFIAPQVRKKIYISTPHYELRILVPIRQFNDDCILWFELRFCLFTKNDLISTQSNIYLNLEDVFKKSLQCLDFCIRLLEFDITCKTNYMHRKNKKFRKIGLIAPTSETSSLIISSASLLIEVQKRNFISCASCGIFIDLF